MTAAVERAMAVEVDQRVRIAAPPERVWRALTEPDELRRWLFASAVADVREGGSWRFTFPHWPSARGLHHPALNFGGPIVELDPGRVLAVAFEPPYWGVLRFEVSPAPEGAELRTTQRGFEGNEEWLADFRGGWGSFGDRLAVLCETGEVPAVRHLEATRAAERTLEPGELSGSARAARRPPGAALLVRRGRPDHARPPRSARPAAPTARAARKPATRSPSRSPPPPTWRRPARASRARSPVAAGRPPGRCARRSTPRTRAGCELVLPYRPALDRADPEPFVRAFERAFCAPGRAAAGAYFAPGGALALAGGPHPRPLDTPLGRLPAGAVARFWRLRLTPEGVLSADWEGNGWTAGRNRGTSTWTFAADGRIERLILRFDPAAPRMVAA